jgi:hypothetical protein
MGRKHAMYILHIISVKFCALCPKDKQADKRMVSHKRRGHGARAAFKQVRIAGTCKILRRSLSFYLITSRPESAASAQRPPTGNCESDLCQARGKVGECSWQCGESGGDPDDAHRASNSSN